MVMPSRLTVVGDRERADHYHLPKEARCYFWGEYTPYEYTDGLRWSYSATNRLISNFKKKLDRQGQSDWPYKDQATQQIADAFSSFWRWDALHHGHRLALIPLPPSRAREDPLYDSRMLEVLRGIALRVALELDIRDCLSFSGIHAASHESQNRPTPDDLCRSLRFDPSVGRVAQKPGIIFLFDDMLTTGAHYLAASQILNEKFPGVPVFGNFVARRIIPNPFVDLNECEEF